MSALRAPRHSVGGLTTCFPPGLATLTGLQEGDTILLPPSSSPSSPPSSSSSSFVPYPEYAYTPAMDGKTTSFREMELYKVGKGGGKGRKEGGREGGRGGGLREESKDLS